MTTARLAPLAIAVALLGCGGPDLATPPEIAYGTVECARCRMIVSDPHHAAAFVAQDGTPTLFDDPGCLLAALATADPKPAVVWVNDVATGEWLPAAQAVYVRAEPASTPMGSGLLAFRSREEALRDGAAVESWGEVSGAAQESKGGSELASGRKSAGDGRSGE